MNKPTPYKKLSFLERVTSFDYRGIQNFHNLYEKGEIEFIEGEFGGVDSFKNKYPNDYSIQKILLDGDKWITFDKCFEIQIFLNGKEIHAKVICKRDRDGYPNGIKWIAMFKIKAKHLQRFEPKMDYLIEAKAVKQYDREREEEEKKRIEEIKKTLLSSM